MGEGMRSGETAEVTTIGLDLAKNVFQAHGAGTFGEMVFCKQLRRRQVLTSFAAQPRCVVAMEACMSTHHWAQVIGELGHDVRPDFTGLRQAVRRAAE